MTVSDGSDLVKTFFSPCHHCVYTVTFSETHSVDEEAISAELSCSSSDLECLITCCDSFADFFVNKIIPVCSDLDSALGTKSTEKVTLSYFAESISVIET